jgi:hypothetical protein
LTDQDELQSDGDDEEDNNDSDLGPAAVVALSWCRCYLQDSTNPTSDIRKTTKTSAIKLGFSLSSTTTTTTTRQ